MLSDNLSPNVLRPIFSNALSIKLETIKLDAFIQNYSTGQTLPGKVIQVLPEQKAVVELQGEKILLQFPRAVTPGQNIAIKIEQTHPNPILKLVELSSFTPSQKTAPSNWAKEVPPVITQQPDKTSIQSRPSDPFLKTTTPNPNAEPGTKSRQAVPVAQDEGPLTKTHLKPSNVEVVAKGKSEVLVKTDLKPLGIETGQRLKAEVLRVVDGETLLARLNSNTVTVKYAASQKFQPGEHVTLYAKTIASEKFVLVAEQSPTPASTVRPALELSVLKNYLSTREPLSQVLTGLKEIFLEGPLTQLKTLNIDSSQLKQLQDNLQKIVSGKLKVPDAVQLKEIIDRSGFNYEAKVKDFAIEPSLSSKNILLENDLKGQLMRLSRQLEQVSTGVAESTASDKYIGKLMAQVNQAVSNIELQQLTHHFSKEEHHPILLQLPDNLLSEEDRFKIYILPDQKEGGGKGSDTDNRVFNLVFLLNLSALGDLRIETKLFKEDVSIQIVGSNSDAIQFIQAHIPELESLFQEEGFTISVSSRHQMEVAMEVPDSLGQLLIDTPLQMVDLKT